MKKSFLENNLNNSKPRNLYKKLFNKEKSELFYNPNNKNKNKNISSDWINIQREIY